MLSALNPMEKEIALRYCHHNADTISPSSALSGMSSAGYNAPNNFSLSAIAVAGGGPCPYTVAVCDGVFGVQNKIANMFAGATVIAGIIFHEVYSIV